MSLCRRAHERSERHHPVMAAAGILVLGQNDRFLAAAGAVIFAPPSLSSGTRWSNPPLTARFAYPAIDLADWHLLAGANGLTIAIWEIEYLHSPATGRITRFAWTDSAALRQSFRFGAISHHRFSLGAIIPLLIRVARTVTRGMFRSSIVVAAASMVALVPLVRGAI